MEIQNSFQTLSNNEEVILNPPDIIDNEQFNSINQLDYNLFLESLIELNVTNWTTIQNNCYEGIQWIGEPTATKEEVDQKIEELRQNLPMQVLRRERDLRIASTDWWVLPDRTPTPEQLSYRQALRDLPENVTPVLTEDKTGVTGFDWPEKP
jgi:hypothetical protein